MVINVVTDTLRILLHLWTMHRHHSFVEANEKRPFDEDGDHSGLSPFLVEHGEYICEGDRV